MSDLADECRPDSTPARREGESILRAAASRQSPESLDNSDSCRSKPGSQVDKRNPAAWEQCRVHGVQCYRVETCLRALGLEQRHGVELRCGLAEIATRGDVVPLEHARCLVPGHHHRHALPDARTHGFRTAKL